jgi:hypothetical protein
MKHSNYSLMKTIQIQIIFSNRGGRRALDARMQKKILHPKTPI